MSGARLAALKLASLSAADRAWVLQNLSEHERKKVEPAMSAVLRLQAHEIEKIVHENRAKFQPAARAKKLESDVSDIQRIRTASIGQIGKVLDELDPACLALFLDSQDWPWLTVYLNWKGPETRNRLAEVLKQVKGKVSPNLLDLVTERIAQRLQPEAAILDQKSRFETLLIEGHSGDIRPQRGTVVNHRRDGVSA
jgi:predicted CopG family antitoxin